MLNHNYSEGRPLQDGSFQNLRSVSNLTASKLTASEIHSNIVVTGTVVSDHATITNLTATNLTVTNAGSLDPFLGYVSLPLPVAVCSGNALYNVSQLRLGIYVAGNDKASWSVYVPASSSTLHIYVPMISELNSGNELIVTVNGTPYLVTSATLKSNTLFVSSTSACSWVSSGMMDVSVTASMQTGGLFIGDTLFVGP